MGLRLRKGLRLRSKFQSWPLHHTLRGGAQLFGACEQRTSTHKTWCRPGPSEEFKALARKVARKAREASTMALANSDPKLVEAMRSCAPAIDVLVATGKVGSKEEIFSIVRRVARMLLEGKSYAQALAKLPCPVCAEKQKSKPHFLLCANRAKAAPGLRDAIDVLAARLKSMAPPSDANAPDGTLDAFLAQQPVPEAGEPADAPSLCATGVGGGPADQALVREAGAERMSGGRIEPMTGADASCAAASIRTLLAPGTDAAAPASVPRSSVLPLVSQAAGEQATGVSVGMPIGPDSDAPGARTSALSDPGPATGTGALAPVPVAMPNMAAHSAAGLQLALSSARAASVAAAEVVLRLESLVGGAPAPSVPQASIDPEEVALRLTRSMGSRKQAYDMQLENNGLARRGRQSPHWLTNRLCLGTPSETAVSQQLPGFLPDVCLQTGRQFKPHAEDFLSRAHSWLHLDLNQTQHSKYLRQYGIEGAPCPHCSSLKSESLGTNVRPVLGIANRPHKWVLGSDGVLNPLTFGLSRCAQCRE